jgi:hypothetical protein
MEERVLKSACANYIFQAFAYYLAWFVSILYAARHNNIAAVISVAAIVVLQVFWQLYRKDTKYFFVFVLCLALVGSVVDTELMQLHIIHFKANPFVNIAPPWMMMLWVCFAIVVFSLLKKYTRHFFVLGVLSFIFFPLAYYLGAKLGAASFPLGCNKLIYVGMIWAFLFPLYLLLFADRLENHA